MKIKRRIKNKEVEMIKTNDAEKEQIRMDLEIKNNLEKIFVTQINQLNAMMEPKYKSCNYEDRTVILEFPVLKWQLNRVGVMHGGMISSAFDLALGVLARFESGLNFIPTISLDTTFLKSVSMGEELIVVGKIVSSGRTLTHLLGEAYLKGENKLVAIAKASYMNVDTTIK